MADVPVDKRALKQVELEELAEGTQFCNTM
jgi:hypothetical protein